MFSAHAHFLIFCKQSNYKPGSGTSEGLIFRAFLSHYPLPLPRSALEPTLGASSTLSGCSWASLGHPCLALGASWELFSPSWPTRVALLGVPWDALRALLGSWGALGPHGVQERADHPLGIHFRSIGVPFSITFSNKLTGWRRGCGDWVDTGFASQSTDPLSQDV